MHHFQHQGPELYCENVPVAEIAERVGTPFFLYSHATLERHYANFNRAFNGIEHLVCYSAKANTNLAILKLFSKWGSGLDIVSGGELYRGLKAGFEPGKIVFSGVGKREDEIDYALEQGILMFNVESLKELESVNARAEKASKVARVAIRVNPDVDPQTHPYICTGLYRNKFGIDSQGAMDAYLLAQRLKHIQVSGIDCHIGSQITESAPFCDALLSLKGFVATLREKEIHLEYIDVGGGLGITYDQEEPPELAEYARVVVEVLQDTGLKLILEPGRVIVGNAGILVTKVLYRKTGPHKRFVIVDAGMNDLLRPSLYEAYHAIVPIYRRDKEMMNADVVGPICESSDFLARDRKLASVDPGDLLAVMSAGAYGFSMSSNYCSRLRAAEVLVREDDYHIIRTREELPDLVKGEKIPPFLT